MKEKIERVMTATKSVAKNLLIYGVIIISVIASFIIGYNYHKLKYKHTPINQEIVKVKKSDVTIAIDESHHLIIINNDTGDYTVYQDSIGKTIFKLYAANVWGQHSTVTNSINP